MRQIYECDDCHWISERPAIACPICGMPINSSNNSNSSNSGTLDDHDRRYDDFYSEQQGDIGDAALDFYDYEPNPYDGTWSEE